MTPIDMDHRRFVAALRAMRTALGWSQAELSRRLRVAGLTNVHPNTVARTEKGERSIRLDEAQTIAALFGVDITQMLTTDHAWVDRAALQLQINHAQEQMEWWQSEHSRLAALLRDGQ